MSSGVQEPDRTVGLLHTRRLRVGVNLLWLVPGEVGGTESWVAGVLGAIAADPDLLPDGVDVVVFATPAVVDAHPWLAGGAFDVVQAPRPIGPSRALRIVAESTWLAVAARRAGVDVLHHPGGTIPPLRLSPAVVTVHDLQPLALPEHFAGPKLAYLRARLGPSVRKSRVVTAVSEFTRNDIADRLGVPTTDIVLTPPAVEPDPPPAPVDAADVCAAYRLDGRRWFLYPAITYAHKNHGVLLRALAAVRRHHPDIVLVLTGGSGPAEAALRTEAERLGVGGAIRRPGRVPGPHLDRLYRGAVACTFPSRFEGVGLPVLEAMARRCPVIASDATGLPDVVGEAGILVDPDDADGWAAAMTTLLDDDDNDGSRRTELVDAGTERVRGWAPSVSAGRLVHAWQRAAGPRP